MTEITRETLELAALAIGGTLSPGNAKVRVGETWDHWEWRGPLGIEVAGTVMRPHLDDGDAFRLAVSAKLVMHPRDLLCNAWPSGCRLRDLDISTVRHNGTPADAARAAREAIVLCAAEVGRRMRGER